MAAKGRERLSEEKGEWKKRFFAGFYVCACVVCCEFSLL